MSYLIPLSGYCIRSILSGVEMLAKSFMDENISMIKNKGETITLELALEELIRRAFSPCFVFVSIKKMGFGQMSHTFEISLRLLPDGETHTIKNG